MNLQETVELLSALKSSGAKYFKSNDFEVSFSSFVIGSKDQKPIIEPDTIELKSQPKIDPDSNFNPIATKQAEDLIDILKMKDEELVNKIFPAGS